MAKCLFRECRAVRASHSLAISETVSMKKPPTGEPYAGKPPVRFGGRGRRKPIPTPISPLINALWGFANLVAGFILLRSFVPHGFEAPVGWIVVGLGILV